MTDAAAVQSFERVTDDSGEAVHVSAVECGEPDDPGSPRLTLENYAPCGDDAPPLDTDFVATKDAAGNGTKQAIGYLDPKNKGKALGGEKRIYARDPDDGSVVAELWLKGDGSFDITAIKSGADIRISTLQSGGVIDLNGVKIDKLGNITAPGEVIAMALTPATQVHLSTHLHTSAAPGSPTSPPTPGT